MSCPFARLAAFASPADIAKAKRYFAAHGHGSQKESHEAASPSHSHSSETLSTYLKHATAKAHREVESSEGVRRLMGFASGSLSGDEDGHWALGRLDYVRWMLMLACIYAAMESGLLAQQLVLAPASSSSSQSLSPVLAPLISARPQSSAGHTASTLLDHIYRFRAIMQDVRTHLQELSLSTGNEEGAGLDFDELLESLRDNPTDSSDDQGLEDLQKAMQEVDQFPLLYTSERASASLSHLQLTPSLLSLLSPSQAESTAIYVRRLLALSSSGSPDASGLLLAHAYVRYLGDLSGGQHIRKRVEKLWPIDASSTNVSKNDGFAFYEFPSRDPTLTASAWHRELKDCFRVAMDAALEPPLVNSPSARSALMLAQGEEASLAFELNKDLFEGLIGNAPDERRRPRNAMRSGIPHLPRSDSMAGSDQSSGASTPSLSSSMSTAASDSGDEDATSYLRHHSSAMPVLIGPHLKHSATVSTLTLLHAAHPWASSLVPLAIGVAAAAVVFRGYLL
ncbi:unnamed protein product [Parajaminaea phylloscopi]